MKKIKDLQSELNAQIKKQKFPSRKQQEIVRNYMTSQAPSNMQYLGLRIPVIRSILKNDLQIFKENLSTQFEVFEKNWFMADSFDQKHLSLFWLESLSDEDLLKYSKRLLKWASIIDNWAHSDSLCGSYSRIFDIKPKLQLKTFQQWNRHKSPWLRRISMIGFVYYARLRTHHPSFQQAKKFVVPHLKAKEHYVQKAVGWTLREMYTVYPKETLKLLDQNIKNISSIAWVAASERLKPAEKKTLLLKRKSQFRKRN
jgi:3-methyladenine DNA glycosylase AlkD